MAAKRQPGADADPRDLPARAVMLRADGDGWGHAEAGRLAHRLLAELIQAGTWDAESVLDGVGRMVRHEPRLLLGARQGRSRLVSTAAVYARLFAPAPGTWALEGSEVEVPGARLDLLWRLGDGRLLADEVKTGAPWDREESSHLEAQLVRQWRGGQQRFGEAFTGIRCLLVEAPRDSFLYRAGQRSPLEVAGGWQGATRPHADRAERMWLTGPEGPNGPGAGDQAGEEL